MEMTTYVVHVTTFRILRAIMDWGGVGWGGDDVILCT